jgi:pimeloyl-ACP methyl ester carboxylesterase
LGTRFGPPSLREQLSEHLHLARLDEVDKGGHFAAWEEPELFTSEVRAGFRALR